MAAVRICVVKTTPNTGSLNLVWQQTFQNYTNCNGVKCLSNVNNMLFARHLYVAFGLMAITDEQLELGM
jgi:hypothetical protein